MSSFRPSTEAQDAVEVGQLPNSARFHDAIVARIVGDRRTVAIAFSIQDDGLEKCRSRRGCTPGLPYLAGKCAGSLSWDIIGSQDCWNRRVLVEVGGDDKGSAAARFVLQKLLSLQLQGRFSYDFF